MQSSNIFVTIEAAGAPVGAMVIRYMKVDRIQKVRVGGRHDDTPMPSDFEPDWRAFLHIQVVSSPDEISKAVMDAKEHFQKIFRLEKDGVRIATSNMTGLGLL
jgi:hypothetical protein